MIRVFFASLVYGQVVWLRGFPFPEFGRTQATMREMLL
jgi:hypothetical protein